MTNQSKRSYLLLLLIPIFLIGSYFLYKKVFSSNAEIIHPVQGSIVESVYGLGLVSSDKVYRLKLASVSILEHIFVIEGQMVAKDDPLIRLDDGRIFKSPFAGKVLSVPYHDHETVFSQAEILVLSDLSQRHIHVSLEQKSATKVKAGQKAWLSFEGLRDQKIAGDVESIYPSEGQFLVRITPPNLPDQILPDMTADVAIEIRRSENAWTIPVRAVREGSLKILRDGQWQKTPVTLGVQNETLAEVLTPPLKADDEILIEAP